MDPLLNHPKYQKVRCCGTYGCSGGLGPLTLLATYASWQKVSIEHQATQRAVNR